MVRRRPFAAFALALLVLVIVTCVAAPLVAPYPPDKTNLLSSLQGPSLSHLAGTDKLGRDTFSRLLYGGRLTLLYAAIVSGVALLTAVPLGLISGYRGGPVDRAIMSVNDIGLALPVLVVVLVVLSVFSEYLVIAMAALGLLLAPPMLRTVRGAALAVRRELFVDAAVVAGLSRPQIVFRHILPRVRGPVLVQSAIVAALAVQFTVGLSFLGFVANPPEASWGSIIAEGAQVLSKSSWMLLFGGGITAVVVLCLGIVGDALRDIAVGSWTRESTAASRRRRGRRRVAAEPPAPAPRPASSAALLAVRGLSIAFGEDEDLLVARDVNFTIEPGQAVGLVGESGCGKTSVARSIIRLLSGDGRVVAGQIEFDGRDVLGLSGADLASYRGGSVGYVAQMPMAALDPTVRVGPQIEEVLRAHESISRAEARERTIELLAKVRLPKPAEVARLYPHEISGGMAQRVSIARAVAAKPRLLIADEPTTALDVTLQAAILDLLRNLGRELGMAILLVSHDLGVVSELCDRAMVMYAGEIVEQGPVDDLLFAPAHPYTEALAACRPSSTTVRDRPLLVIPGQVPAPGDWPRHCHFADRCSHRTEQCVQRPVPIEPVGKGRESRCVYATEMLREGTREKARA